LENLIVRNGEKKRPKKPQDKRNLRNVATGVATPAL
jgi:hypothetical protein